MYMKYLTVYDLIRKRHDFRQQKVTSDYMCQWHIYY